jgi:hypothetical protein
MRVIRITNQTRDMLGACAIYGYSDSSIADGPDHRKIIICDEVAEKLAAIDSDPDKAIRILIMHGVLKQ